MYENDLYLLIDQIITLITLTIWILTFIILYVKLEHELHKLDGYMNLKENLKGLELDYYKLKYEYRSNKLNYKLKVKELKNAKKSN